MGVRRGETGAGTGEETGEEVPPQHTPGRGPGLEPFVRDDPPGMRRPASRRDTPPVQQAARGFGPGLVAAGDLGDGIRECEAVAPNPVRR